MDVYIIISAIHILLFIGACEFIFGYKLIQWDTRTCATMHKYIYIYIFVVSKKTDFIKT